MIGRATLGRPTLGAVRRSDVAPRATVRVLGGGSALGAVAPPAPSPEEQARAYARAIRWRLRIPGEHYSGLSNQAMLDVRAREGRDFAADTPLLRANANRALYAEARAWARWSEVRAARVWSDVVFDQILARLENGGGEGFAVRPLTPRYARWKARHGGAGKPIGVLTGRWRRALGRGRVEVL